MSRLSGLRGVVRGYFGQLKWRGLILRKGRWPRPQSVEILEDRQLLAATVVTDQSDYAPGETAIINGAGYRTGETIQLQVLHTDGTPNTGGGHDPWYVTDGGSGDLDGTANGQFRTTWYVNPDDSAGSVFELSALGLTSGRLATTTFTDAAVNMEAWANISNAWTTSVIQPSNSEYPEGGTIPLRFSDLNEAAGSVHTVVLKYDFSGTGSSHFFDWLDSYNASQPLTPTDATVGIANLGSPATVTIPTDTTLPMGAQTPAGVFTTYNIASLTFDPAPQYSLTAGVKALTVHYTVSGNPGDPGKNVAIVYGGHLSTEALWGVGNGALAFPGASPKSYASLDGGQDKSVSVNPNAIVSILVNITGTTDGSEAGPTGAVFTVTQSQATATDTVLAFSLGGTATSGSDYSPPLTVTIPAGQTSATITLPVIDDSFVEPTEDVVLTLTGISSSASGVTLGATTSANRNITDNDTSSVSVAVSPNSVLEDGAGNLIYTFTRSNTTANTPALTANFGVTGTATSGTDYAAIGTTSVSFAVGSSTATVTVDPTVDATVEPDETVILSVQTGSGYAVGSPGIATGTITNDDSSTVSVAVSPLSVLEDGATNLVYTFTRTNTSAESPALTVNYGVSGTATTGTDYTGTGTTVTFAAGSSTATVTVDPATDATVEPNESVILTVLVGAGYSVGSPSAATGTINNDDSSAVSIAVSPSSVSEDGVMNLTYTFTRSNTSAETPTLTVNYGVSGTASTGTDYTGTGTTVAFLAGSSTATVTVDPTSDTNVEPDESVILTVQAGSGYTVGGPSVATGTISNDDSSSVSVAVSPLSVAEDGVTNLVYTFTRSNTTAQSPALTVNYGVGGTASTGTDYTGTGTTVTFAAGSSTATVTADPTADTAVEPDETIILTVQSGSGYSVGGPSVATGTITNDDSSSVSVAVSPVSVAEDGATNLVYTFTRSNTTAQSPALTVNYGVSGTATAGTDYTGTGTTVTFAIGSSTAIVAVDPTTDTDVEPDETVILTVLVGVSYTIGSPSAATGTITNDDSSSVSVAVSPVSVSEDGATNLVYTFTRSNTTAQSPALTVNYDVNGTATTGTDYIGTGTTVTFTAGSSTATVTVNPTVDTNVEPDETVSLTVQSGGGYSVGAPSVATGTIANDDVSSVSVAVVAPASVLEDGATNLVYTFTRSNTTAQSPSITVNYGVSGTATTGTDYTGAGTTVTFAAGSSTAIVTVDPTSDTDVEPDESVILTLQSGGGYLVGSPSAATGMIVNDDSSSVSVAVSPQSVAEDDATNLLYTFTRSNTTAQSPALTVNYGVSGTATTGTDYTGTGTTVAFAAGSSTATVTVNPTSDTTVESHETVILTVAAGNDYSIESPSSATGTITDNDTASVTVNDVTVVEGVGLLFTVTLDNAVQGGTQVDVTLSDETATGGAVLAMPVDYANVVASLSFSGTTGETKQFTVATLNDPVVEPTETFSVSLNAANPLVTDSDMGTGTITDNDHAPVANANIATLALGGTLTVLDAGALSVLGNDSDADVPAQTLHAILVTGPLYATSFVLNDNGTFVYINDSSSTVPDSFTYLVSDGFNNSNVVTVTITIVPPDILAVGADVGTLSHPSVKVFNPAVTNPDGTPKLRFVITPDKTYEPVGTTYNGGVRIATGDINGDGVADIVTAPGRGKAPDIKVFSGINGALIGSFRAKDLGKSYKKGVYVAVGDVTGDGKNDIVVSPELGKPKVVVYRNTGSNYGTTSGGFSLYSSKKVFSDFKKYVGGATVAVGNVNGDGRAEVIVGSGAGMATLVRAFDVVPTTNPLKGTMTQIGPDIRNSFTGGVYVAAGDLTGDGKAEIVTGSASGTALAGAGSKVRIYNALTGSELNSFDAFPETADVPTAAVRVAVSAGKILTAQGPDGRSQYHVRGFNPADLSAIDSLFAASLQDSDDLNNIGTFQGFPDFFFGGGMFVAANEPAIRQIPV